MTTSCTQGAVVPVRLKGVETGFLKDAAEKTGYKQAEIIRRALRMLRAEAKKQNGFSFMMELADA